MAISPDGRTLVFAAPSQGAAEQLWVRSLDASVGTAAKGVSRSLPSRLVPLTAGPSAFLRGRSAQADRCRGAGAVHNVGARLEFLSVARGGGDDTIFFHALGLGKSQIGSSVASTGGQPTPVTRGGPP